jgi:hypothetical protein
MSEDQNRFTGYAPPLIQLDGTGPAYWVSQVNPYYYNQPQDWLKTGGEYMVSNSINTRNIPVNEETYPQLFCKDQNCGENKKYTGKLYPLL